MSDYKAGRTIAVAMGEMEIVLRRQIETLTRELAEAQESLRTAETLEGQAVAECQQAEDERDAAIALLREAAEEILDIRNDLTFAPTMQDRLDALRARITAATGEKDG